LPRAALAMPDRSSSTATSIHQLFLSTMFH
jgi:hypothetical protein